MTLLQFIQNSNILTTSIYVLNVIVGIGLLIYTFNLKKNIIAALYMFSVLWGVVISVSYPLINWMWHDNILQGKVIIPPDLEYSFELWEGAVACVILFMFIRLILIIRMNTYGSANNY